MKTFKKTLKVILLSILTLIFILLATVAWFISNPKKAYEVAEKYFLPNDLKITWQKWDLDFSKLEGWNFKIDWEVDDLLIVKAKPHLHVPIQRIRLRANLAPFEKTVFVKNLEIAAKHEIEFEPSQDKKPTPEKNIFQQVQTGINLLTKIHDRVTYENIDIQIDKFSLLNPGTVPLEFAGLIHSDKSSPALHYDIKLKRGGEKTMQGKLNGFIDPSLMKTEKSFLESKIDFQGFNVDVDQQLEAQYQSNTAFLNLKGHVNYKTEKFKIISQPKIKISVDAKSAKLELDTDIQGMPGFVTKVNDLKLRTNTPLDESVIWSEKPTIFSLTAPLELTFFNASVKQKLQKNCDCKLPLSLIAKAAGKVWLAQLFNDEAQKHTFVDANVSLESVKNKLFSVDLASSIKIEKDKTNWKFFPVLDCKASIADFKGIAPLFDMYKIMIPAPLDVLNGTVNFEAKGPVTQDEKGSQFPAKLNVALSSKRQLVRLNNEAVVLISPDYKKINVQTKAHIDDLQIELPPLDPVGGKPRVTVDKRILKTPPITIKESKFQISFNIEVETAHAAAIRLLSEYFKPYLPLTLKVGINSAEGKNGFIQAEPFDIVYLRRKVHVEKLFLDLNQIDNDIIPVDGRFKIQQTHYTVYIDVKGNAKSPNITMTSEPELSQSDIISVLLYDRVNSELASADAETTGGVQAAIADRAIGLFGLWAFASTPIRSFSYNPVTKVYTATVSLGKDVTAGIGTTWESTAQLELRKRVSRQWMLTASWTAATPEKDQNTEIVLQWEKRF